VCAPAGRRTRRGYEGCGGLAVQPAASRISSVHLLGQRGPPLRFVLMGAKKKSGFRFWQSVLNELETIAKGPPRSPIRCNDSRRAVKRTRQQSAGRQLCASRSPHPRHTNPVFVTPMAAVRRSCPRVMTRSMSSAPPGNAWKAGIVPIGRNPSAAGLNVAARRRGAQRALPSESGGGDSIHGLKTGACAL
jgi:hypothetical protein